MRVSILAALAIACSGTGEVASTDAGSDADTAVLPTDGATDSQPIFPSCADGVLNGSESDVDCGGVECATCARGRTCIRNEDCTDAVCVDNKCALPRSCAELRRTGIKSGVYPLEVDGTELPFYCDMVTEGGGYTLVYKINAGVSAQAAALWTSPTPLNDTDKTVLTGTKGTKNYVSRIVTKLWNLRFPVEDVRVSLVVAGKEVKYFKFDGRGSSVVNWFVPARLITSSYTDTGPTMTTNVFSIAGDPSAHREWFINRAYGGCAVDNGWLVVDWTPDPCAWESENPAVRILYAPGTIAANWSTSGSRAEAMLVFVR